MESSNEKKSVSANTAERDQTRDEAAEKHVANLTGDWEKAPGWYKTEHAESFKAGWAARDEEVNDLRNSLNQTSLERDDALEENKRLRDALEHYQSAHYCSHGMACFGDQTAALALKAGGRE